VPNMEIRYLYETRILDWVSAKLNIDSDEYSSFITLLADGKIQGFKSAFQEFLLRASSFHQTGGIDSSETFYNGFMLCMLNILSTYYIIDSDRESGEGRPDIVFIPKANMGKTNAIIMEYKVAKKEDDLTNLAQEGFD